MSSENFNKACGEAVKAGYKPKVWAHTSSTDVLLDPEWWSALGKARGWEKYIDTDYVGREDEYIQDLGWKVHWHRFIDHLAEGKDAESFFKELYV